MDEGGVTTKEIYTVRIRRDVGSGVAVLEDWSKDSEGKVLHREDGPASIERDAATGNVIREGWYNNNVLERESGPAVIRRDATTGRVTYSVWYKNGEKIAPPHRPVRRRRSSPSMPRR
jgi:hypothetical protein